MWKEDDVEIVWADDKAFQATSDARYYSLNCRPIQFQGTNPLGNPKNFLSSNESVCRKQAKEFLNPQAIVSHSRPMGVPVIEILDD